MSSLAVERGRRDRFTGAPPDTDQPFDQVELEGQEWEPLLSCSCPGGSSSSQRRRGGSLENGYQDETPHRGPRALTWAVAVTSLGCLAGLAGVTFGLPSMKLSLGDEGDLNDQSAEELLGNVPGVTELAFDPTRPDPLAGVKSADLAEAAALAAQDAAADTEAPAFRAASMSPRTWGASEVSFYAYRAQSAAHYPLENVNAADLAGAMWYLHHEVVAATPRKYHIDRIRRFKITMLNTREFWNVHHATFAPFFAFDGGRCTTPDCGNFYRQYGFLVGCQAVSLAEGAYQEEHATTSQCEPGTSQCYAPLWLSFPGPCPDEGLQQQELAGNQETLDVSRGKSSDCLSRMPGGRCKAGGPPTGTPDCTYSVEEAGEILLDELAGIDDYNDFWNTSYYECQKQFSTGQRTEPCRRHKEYDGHLDAGVGNHFWDGKRDPRRCQARIRAAEALFRSKYPQWPELSKAFCDFDTIYANEFTWPANHTGAPESSWWQSRPQ